MKKTIAISVAIFLIIISAQPIFAGNTKEDLAVAASDAWLKLVDNGKYDRSWKQAAEYFKKSLTKKQWANSMISFRKPLGKMLSRKVISRQYMRSLPGAPDGEYVVIQYSTSFKNKRSAVETVTPMMDKDGKWRVSGYFIK